MGSKKHQRKEAKGDTPYHRDEDALKALIDARLRRDVQPEEAEAVSDALQYVFGKIEGRLEGEEHGREGAPLMWVRWLRIAAVWLAMVTTGFVCWEQWLNPYRIMDVSTGIGERRLVTLHDGTKVWLSPQSTFRYPRQFKASQREVTLSGEAFFDVAKDSAHAFVVYSGELQTRVLGTSFNIDARKDKGTASVTVVTGKVAISRESGDEPMAVELKPNQRVLFDKSKQTLTKEIYPEAPKLLMEREGIYDFEGAPVTEVLERLKREYRIQVRTEGNLVRCKFHGALNAGEDVEQFLRKLCIVLNADWRKVDDYYIITFQGC